MLSRWYCCVVMSAGRSAGIPDRNISRAALRTLVVVWRACGSMMIASSGTRKSRISDRFISTASENRVCFGCT